MADLKISELPAASTPLNAGDLIEIVQGGVNKKANKSDVGTAVSDATNSVKGIDFISPNGYAVTDTTGTVIQFDIPKTYGSVATPETGNITLNSTGLIKGMVQLCLHNNAAIAPTFGAEFFKIGGNYVTNQLNSIYFHAVSSARIEYTINQTS